MHQISRNLVHWEPICSMQLADGRIYGQTDTCDEANSHFSQFGEGF
jgi:hypothetical protein